MYQEFCTIRIQVSNLVPVKECYLSSISLSLTMSTSLVFCDQSVTHSQSGSLSPIGSQQPKLDLIINFCGDWGIIICIPAWGCMAKVVVEGVLKQDDALCCADTLDQTGGP